MCRRSGRVYYRAFVIATVTKRVYALLLPIFGTVGGFRERTVRCRDDGDENENQTTLGNGRRAKSRRGEQRRLVGRNRSHFRRVTFTRVIRCVKFRRLIDCLRTTPLAYCARGKHYFQSRSTSLSLSLSPYALYFDNIQTSSVRRQPNYYY